MTAEMSQALTKQAKSFRTSAKNSPFAIQAFDVARQVILVAVTSSLFLFGHILGALFALYLLLTPLYPAVIVYLVWLFWDLEKSSRGGRRVDWFRRLKSWEYLRDYFPVVLKKTRNLDPSRNYIMGYHPHGIMCSGAFCNFATEGTGFSKLFPGIKPHLLTLKLLFKFPFFRDICMALGVCDVSRQSIQHICTKQGKGNAVVVVIGGAAESLDARPGSFVLTLKNRKGFVRLALQSGASLVPVFSFGENEVFNQVHNPRGSRLRHWQNKFQKVFAFAPPLFFGRGIFRKSIGYIPYQCRIVTVVGAPIHVKKVAHPSQQQIDRVHCKYVKGLKKIFEEHKHQYVREKSVKLEIV